MDDPRSPTPPLHLPTIGRRHKLFWRGVDQYWELFVILAVMLKLALPMIAGRDFWYDESVTGIIVQNGWHELLRIVLDGNPANTVPYYGLATIWATLFGTSAAAIRSASLLFGLVDVVGVYIFARLLFNRTTAAIAAIIAATSPFVLQYATEARSYSLLGALVIFATIYAILAARRKRWTDHALWGILMAMAVLTHNATFLFFAPITLTYFWEIFRSARNHHDRRRTILQHILDCLPKFALAIISAAAVFSPWLPIFLLEYYNRSNYWVPSPALTDIPSTLMVFLFGSIPGTLGVPPLILFCYGILNEIIPYLLLPTLAGVSVWLYMRAKHWQAGSLQTALLAFGPLVSAYLLSFRDMHLLVSRFVFPAALFLAALLAAWLVTLKWPARVIAIGVFVTLLFLRQPIDLPTGYSQLSKIPLPPTNTFYLLNPFDYNVVKFYFIKNPIALFNLANPGEDFAHWETIGPYRKILNMDEILNDPTAIVIYNANLAPSPDSFPLSRLTAIGQYDNLTLYRPR